jgi:FlaG/FlaF family flagellin (archaellin)
MLPIAVILLLTAAVPVAAAAPVQSTTTGSFTLADAIFEYQNFDVYDGDCGDFVLLVDYDVVREVTTWPDREIRHVHYDGHFYNASDTSKSIVRSGDFAFTFRFDESGALLELTQTGLFEYVEVDGHRVPTIAGRATTDFTSDPPARWDTPRASTETPAFVCEALR